MTDTHRSRLRVLTSFAAFAFTTLAVVVMARDFWKTWSNRMALGQPFPYRNPRLGDFKDAMFLPARDFLYTNVDPYNWQAFLAAHASTEGYSPYTPSHLWVAALFAWMNWSTATAAWTALVVLSISLMGAIGCEHALRLIRPDASDAARLAVAAAGVCGVWVWRPSYDALVFGQPSGFYAPVAAIVSLSVFTLGPRPHPRGDVATGLWTAVALCKPQVGIQVVLAELVARRWRALAIGVGTAAVFSVFAVARLAGGITRVPAWFVRLPGHVTSAPSRLNPRFGRGWVDVTADLYAVGVRHGVFSLLGPLLAIALLATGWWAIRLARRAHRPWLGALTLTLADLVALPDFRYEMLVLYPMIVMAAAEAWRSARTPATIPTGLLLVVVTASGLIPNQVITFGKSGGPAASAMMLAALGLAVIAVVVWARVQATNTAPVRA